ncbi:hypothetical protein Taro_022122 [Colocasia esculenta]|uniref:Uncharacterized protein n=1 Tax=Colocasia esculenta TaxID=4460 RepID=A0A843V100_COLES|nr:hypothetical protein [Colocasia esculenta]
MPSSITCPIPFSNRGREPSSSGGGGVLASWTPAMLVFWRKYMFRRPEDLPRARAVWESTAQTNFRKSMWEARDKATKITGSQDPTSWMHYGLHYELGRAPTFRELFDQTHKQKGMDGYVSQSARTIAETYDRTMADRYAEGTAQPDLDPKAWVHAAGEPRKGQVYRFGDSLDTTLVLSSHASSVTRLAYASSSTAMPGSGGDDIRTLTGKSCCSSCRCTQAPWSSSWWLPSEEHTPHSKPLSLNEMKPLI